jgi:hypothetical protein
MNTRGEETTSMKIVSTINGILRGQLSAQWNNDKVRDLPEQHASQRKAGIHLEGEESEDSNKLCATDIPDAEGCHQNCHSEMNLFVVSKRMPEDSADCM